MLNFLQFLPGAAVNAQASINAQAADRAACRALYLSRVICGLFIGLLAMFCTEAQAEIRVGKGERYRSVSNALLDARKGETVRIIGGVYRFRDIELPYDIRIIGEGGVVFEATRSVRKGILVPTRNATVHIKGITFRGARSVDKNGAGIRFEAKRLTIIDCNFIDNENGILATSGDNTVVSLKNTRFINNGHGDGYSHGIYMQNGVGLTIENTVFQGTREGHHVKSLAAETVIRDSRFIDAPGWPSYVVDISKGGNLIFEDNEISRSAGASQRTFFNYDTTRGGVAGYMQLERNQFTNEKKGARLVRNPEGVRIYLQDNSVNNIGGASLALPKSSPIAQNTALSPPRAAAPSIAASQNPAPKPPNIDSRNSITVEDLERLSPQQRRAVTRLLAARGDAPVETRLAPSGAEIAAQGINDVKTTIAAGRAKSVETLPAFERRKTANDIVPINIVSLPTSRSSTPSPYKTIGQLFKRGDLRPGEIVAIRMNDRIYPVQVDVKSLYEDGSVKYAGLTLSLPATARGRGMIVTIPPEVGPPEVGLLDSSPHSPAAPFSTSLPETYDLIVRVSGQTGDGVEFSGHVPIRSLWEGSSENWLKGAFVEERMGVKRVGPFLKLRADLRLTTDGHVRSWLTFENYTTFQTGDRSLTYDVEITGVPIGGVRAAPGSEQSREVLFRKKVTQHRGSSWSEIFWHGAAPAYEVQHDPRYLAAAEAFPSYNFDHGIAGKAIDEMIARANDKGPLSLITRYFPTSGGRLEIGPQPVWDIAYLKTQKLKTKSLMLAIAKASADIPWHLEDEKTGEPVRIDNYPTFWLDERSHQVSRPEDRIPKSYLTSDTGGWSTETAHKPSLTYTAYLVTAEAYFARRLAHEAAYSIADTYFEPRANDKGFVAVTGQVRARAWTLRDVSNAAFILPSGWSITSYLQKIRDRNLTELKKRYVTDRIMREAGEVEGYFNEENYRYPGEIAPWQHDYLIIIIAQEALRGSQDARSVINWATRYQTERVLNGKMPPRAGIGYRLATYDPDTKQKYVTWDQVSKNTQLSSKDQLGSGYGYLASGLAALSAVFEVTGNPRAREAYETLRQAFPDDALFDRQGKGSFYMLPTYDFKPPSRDLAPVAPAN